jgi:cobalt/nickel transport system permease protein
MNTPVLAMHMANELLSIPTVGVTLLFAALAVTFASLRARKTIDAEKFPLMGVLGAFIFAAQMINFTLPGMPGTSGHLGGGVLLAILLGPSAAILTMTSILIVQCLLFQDGGLLALGCNVINMGIIPALAGWGVYRLILGRVARAPAWRQYVAAWAACLVGVTAGASLVPVEAGFSGVLKIRVTDFLAIMVGVHLLIAFVEGLITFAVVAFLRQARPALFGLEATSSAGAVGLRGLSRGAVIASLAATALLLAGVVSWFASTQPDGLEWSYLHRAYGSSGKAVENSAPAVAAVDAWQSRWSLMTDYDVRPAPLGAVPSENAKAVAQERAVAKPWMSLAGILGTAVTLGLVYASAVFLRRRG